MEIKYEAVFGDYKFSSPACEVAMQSSFGEIIEMRLTKPLVIPEGWGVIAMRRIIRTPIWTVEDQKAGKLPKVGAEVKFNFYQSAVMRQGVIKYIDDQVAVIQTEDVTRPFCYETCKVVFTPIESPEEKAARMRDEWCNRAMDYSTIQQLYNAMLSGDLPVPVKE